MLETAVPVVVVLFMVGVVFQAGRITARLESIESWRSEVKKDMDAIFTELRTISSAVGAQTER